MDSEYKHLNKKKSNFGLVKIIIMLLLYYLYRKIREKNKNKLQSWLIIAYSVILKELISNAKNVNQVFVLTIWQQPKVGNVKNILI